MGCPVPCGVVITRLEHVKVLSTDIEYLSSRDATIDHIWVEKNKLCANVYSHGFSQNVVCNVTCDRTTAKKYEPCAT